MTTILGISITDRKKEAGKVQQVLTEFGCSIKTRLGLHEVTDKHCSTSGLVLLELTGASEDRDKLEAALNKIEGTQVQKMVFEE